MNRLVTRLRDWIRHEPAVVRSVLGAVAVLLSTAGLDLDEEQIGALATLTLIAAGVSTRQRVVPVRRRRPS